MDNVNDFNQAKDPEPNSPEFDVDECISDLMFNGEGDRGDNLPVLTIDAVLEDIAESITTEQIKTLFGMAQQHQVFESTKMMREMIKQTARQIIESDMPKPVKRAA